MQRVAAEPEQRPRSSPEESDLIRDAQAGDRGSFALLVERYYDPLYRWLYHLSRDAHTAEDLAQESFLKSFAALKTFRLGSNFRAWLFRIAHNNFVNHRANRRQKHALAPEMLEDAAEPADHASGQETIERVNAAVERLPAEFRAALMLRAHEGMSFREIAHVVGTTEQTARWRVFKARQKLMKSLGEELGLRGADDD